MTLLVKTGRPRAVRQLRDVHVTPQVHAVVRQLHAVVRQLAKARREPQGAVLDRILAPVIGGGE